MKKENPQTIKPNLRSETWNFFILVTSLKREEAKQGLQLLLQSVDHGSAPSIVYGPTSGNFIFGQVAAVQHC
jgi:hypothetical protein